MQVEGEEEVTAPALVEKENLNGRFFSATK
jgi:hypothetical protein